MRPFLPMIIACFLTAATAAGQQLRPYTDTSLAHVGDLPFDPATDNPAFDLCGQSFIYQYYGMNTGYKGGKKALRDEILSRFVYNPAAAGANGYITIRFVMNCKGETDRFRVMQINNNYQPASFEPQLVQQLLVLVRSLRGWIPSTREQKNYNTYCYLNFKFVNGHLTDILP